MDKTKIKKVFTPSMGGIIDPYAGYSYYVNSATGNDNNVGTSSLSPFATIAKLLTVWQAGQSVGLAKDSTWKETLSYPGSDSSVHSYGISGNRPILDGSEIAPNASFSKTVGRTNVYEIAVTVETGATQFVNCFEDNAYLTRVTSLANCDSTIASFYVTAESGNITLYVHATADGNVITNGKVYEYTKRIHAIYCADAYSGCSLYGLHGRKALGDGGCIRMRGTNTVVDDFYAQQGGNHTFQINPIGATVSNGTVIDGYSGSRAATLFNYNVDALSGSMTVTNVTIKETSRTQAGWTNVTGMNGHKNISGALASLTFTNCTFQNLVTVSDILNDCSAITITSCTFTDNKFCIYDPTTPPAGGVTLTISGGTWTSAVTSSLFGIYDSASCVTSISGMTFTQSTTTASNGLIQISGATTVSVTNCHFVSTAVGNRVCIYCSNGSANLTLNNNVYNEGSQGWTNIYLFIAAASTMTWASDNNTFKATANTWSIFGTAYSTLVNYQAAVTPRDANSTAT